MGDITSPRVGIVVPTWCAERYLPVCLPLLLSAACRPKLLVIDSSSPDNTVQVAKELGAHQVVVIPKAEFDHGATREKARRLLDVDIVVMATQDINPTAGALDKLIAPLAAGAAALAYGRQVPHSGAGFFEAFPRHYNYPEQGYLCGIGNLQEKGAHLFFCSNSFAAYDMKALDGIGGFPKGLFGEDTAAAAKLLYAGYHIAYVADAVVHHSHSFSLRQEFHRHFDIGLSRRLNEELLQAGHGDARRGKNFALKMLTTLTKSKPYLLPYAVAHLAAKWLGYQLGRRYGMKAMKDNFGKTI